MSYVDRDQAGNIVGIYANPQRDNHEFVEGATLWVPVPTVPELRTATLRKAREMRLPIMQVLDGMQASALVNSDLSLAQSIETAKQSLRNLPQTVDLTPFTTARQMELAVLAAYQAIVIAAPASIKSAFDSLKP
jgi:hypothetical protein